MKQFILEPDLELDYMIVAKNAIEYQQWKCGSDIQITDDLDLSYDVNLVVPIGSVQFVNSIYNKMGLDNLFVENWPDDIKPFMKQRRYGSIYFGNLVKFPDLFQFPIFIKPKEDTKLFMGELIESSKQLLELKQMYQGIKDATNLYWSEPVNFIAEWRSIIFNGEIISFSPYDADKRYHDQLFYKQGEAYTFVKSIASTIDSSKARIVDVGLVDDGTFGVVECANHITTASTYTTMIDRDKYYKALCSVGIKAFKETTQVTL